MIKLIISSFLFILCCCNKVNHDFIISNIEKKEEQSLEDKIQKFAKSLECEISVHPDTFATYIIKVFWSESRFKNIESDNQQSYFQITESTRKYLNIESLKNATDEQILNAYEKYLKATKKLKYVKSSVDLHVLNVAPSNFFKKKLLTVKGKLRYLDFNKNQIIDREDLLIFQKKSFYEYRRSNKTT